MSRTGAARWLAHMALISITTMPMALSQAKLIELVGIVTSQNGEPLSCVTVRQPPFSESQTDQHGRYRVELHVIGSSSCCILQFRLNGYQTVTKAVDPRIGVLDLALHSGDSKWTPPDWNPSDSKRIGGTMRFLIPKGTKVKRGRDIDYWEIAVGFGPEKNREWMEIGAGPNWSWGVPFIDDLTSAAEISERDIACWSGVDIRGRSRDGQKWRFTGMHGESVSYRNASEGAAKFFDSIIDGLHCDQEAVPGFGRLPKDKGLKPF